LALVEALSDMRERAERELDLQMALGPALFATKSWSHPDTGRTYARAWELCRQLGDHSREFTALRGLYLHHQNLLEMEKSQHFAEEALRVAERLGFNLPLPPETEQAFSADRQSQLDLQL